MGNKLTCCWRKQERNESSSNNRRQRTLEDKYVPSHHETEPTITSVSRQLSSSTNLQHISEREPDGKSVYPLIVIKISRTENISTALLSVAILKSMFYAARQIWYVNFI